MAVTTVTAVGSVEADTEALRSVEAIGSVEADRSIVAVVMVDVQIFVVFLYTLGSFVRII